MNKALLLTATLLLTVSAANAFWPFSKKTNSAKKTQVCIGTCIMDGAGIPDESLATAKGAIYINTAAVGANDRIFIAKDEYSWTHITCAE